MTLPCVVLAGGLGTRMRPATELVPKALLPVAGRPFIDWQMDLLAEQGIEEVLLCVGYRGEMIRRHVEDGRRWGVSVTWVDEGDDLRGTAGALRLAHEQGALPPTFFVLYGDSYLPISMSEVELAWRVCGRPALMTVLRNRGRWDASNVVYREGSVVFYDKRRPGRRAGMDWIDYGLSVLSRTVVTSGVGEGCSADLADLMRELSAQGRLAGLEVFERFYEAGSPDGLRDLERYLKSRRVG